jgi:two-component system cell cycle response regulator DivK
MTKRVLLVEDNAASRRLIGDHLRRAGHDVHEVGSADDALSLAVTEAYDLIIMDIQLPGTDGLTATRLLRANPETCTVPILAVTAHAMRGDEARILSAGCDGYVAKPIAYREMLTKVASLLSRSSQRGA